MAGLFKKIVKGILIGGGSILSLFAPAVGAPLILAGTAIDTKKTGTVDIVSGYAANFNYAMNSAAAMSSAASKVSGLMWLNNVKQWVMNNAGLVAAGIGFIVFLAIVKPFKRRRR